VCAPFVAAPDLVNPVLIIFFGIVAGAKPQACSEFYASRFAPLLQGFVAFGKAVAKEFPRNVEIHRLFRWAAQGGSTAMRIDHFFALTFGLTILCGAAHAQSIPTCPDQSPCIQFEVTEIDSPALCTASCEYRICATNNSSAPGCLKTGGTTISHICEKSDAQCTDADNFVGGTQVTDVPDLYVQCQTVSPGSTAEFLYKDGTGCLSSGTDSTVTSGDVVTSAFCQPTTATAGCTARGCIWTVTAPATCSVPETSTTTTTTVTTTTMLPQAICGPAPEPAVNCRLNAIGKGQLQVKDKTAGTPDKADQVKWKWGAGDATSIADFKDPVGGAATYRVCVYQDVSGIPSRVLELNLPPGGTCAGVPCWKSLGSVSSPEGFQYKDKTAAADGLIGVKLQAGDTGKAQIQVKAKGTGLSVPATPLVGDVTVQFMIGDGVTTECFQTTYAPPYDKNIAGQFKAKGP
jgi:hypothetical protein